MAFDWEQAYKLQRNAARTLSARNLNECKNGGMKGRRMFDWVSFLVSNRIDYADSGPNTSRDNIVVHCPFCGSNDPSMHMSVNLSGRGWRCFRDQSHRGKNPVHLVVGLTGMTFESANAMVGNAQFVPDDFMARLNTALVPSDDVERPGLELPREFRTFDSTSPLMRPYERYLKERGFDTVGHLTLKYGVRYCTQGSFAGRIIFPVVFQRKLVAWTGRAISEDAKLRYKALSRDGERTRKVGYEPALGAISHYLLWFDDLMVADADTIVLCEGPFDALKIRVLGRREGVTATCFFTSAPTEQQLYLLRALLPRYKRRIVMLDRTGTFANGIRISNALASLGTTNYVLPKQLKDPGEFESRTFQKFLIATRRTMTHD